MPKAAPKKFGKAPPPSVADYKAKPAVVEKQKPVFAGKPYEPKNKGYSVRYIPAEHRIEIVHRQYPGGPSKIVPVDTHTFYHVDMATKELEQNDDQKFQEAQQIMRVLDIKKDASIVPSVVQQVCKLVYEDLCKDSPLPLNLEELEEKILEKNDHRITSIPMVEPLGKKQLEHKLPQRQAFHEAGCHPDCFIEDPILVHNIANQVIDPLERNPPQPGSITFPPSGENFNFESSFLDLFGFPNCSLESYRVDSTEHAFQLTMEKDNPARRIQFSSENSDLPQPPFTKIKNGKKKPVNYFDGNAVKNTCITNYLDKAGTKKYLSGLLMAKEMGDVFQVLSAFVYDKLHPDENAIIVSNDQVVFCLSLLINMKCIYNHYYANDGKFVASLFDKKSNKVIVDYFVKQCTYFVNHNHEILRELEITDPPLSLTGPSCSLTDCTLGQKGAEVKPQEWNNDSPLSITDPVWYSVFTVNGVKVVHRALLDTIYADCAKIHTRMLERISAKAQELLDQIGPPDANDPEKKRGVKGYHSDAHKDIIDFVQELKDRYKLRQIITKKGRTDTKFPGRCHYVYPPRSLQSYTLSPPDLPLANITFHGKYFDTLLLDYELTLIVRKTATRFEDHKITEVHIKPKTVIGDGPKEEHLELPADLRKAFEPFQEDQKENASMQDGGGGSSRRSSSRRSSSRRSSARRSSSRHSSARSSARRSSSRRSSSRRSSRRSLGKGTFLENFFDFAPVYYTYWSDEGDAFGESLEKHPSSSLSLERRGKERLLYTVDIHSILKEQIYTHLYKNYDEQLVNDYEIDILSYVYENFDVKGHTLFHKGLTTLLDTIMQKHVLPAYRVRQEQEKKEAMIRPLSSASLKQMSKKMSNALLKTLSKKMSRRGSAKRFSTSFSKKMSKKISTRRTRPSASRRSVSRHSPSAFSTTRRRSSARRASQKKKPFSIKWSPIRELSRPIEA